MNGKRSILLEEMNKLKILLMSNRGILLFVFVFAVIWTIKDLKFCYMGCFASSFIFVLWSLESFKEDASFYIPMTLKEKNRRIFCFGNIIAFCYVILFILINVINIIIPNLNESRVKSGYTNICSINNILLLVYLYLVIVAFVLSNKMVMGFSEDVYLFGIKLPRFVRYIFTVPGTFLFSWTAMSIAIGNSIQKYKWIIYIGIVLTLIDVVLEYNQNREADCKWFPGNESK